MKIPLSLKVYAALAFLSAAFALWRAGYIVFTGLASEHSGRLVFELLWAAFNIALGFGILRLRPAWRVVALVCCCWVFAMFVLMLVAWCIWPHSVTWSVMLVMAVAVAINAFYFYRFRQPDVKLLFDAQSAPTPSV